MPDSFGPVVIFLAALTVAVIAYGSARTLEHSRRIADLESRMREMERSNRHDRLGRMQHDIGEADLFSFVRLREELLEAAKLADWYARRAAHVAAGGKPDDPPGTWKTLRED